MPNMLQIMGLHHDISIMQQGLNIMHITMLYDIFIDTYCSCVMSRKHDKMESVCKNIFKA